MPHISIEYNLAVKNAFPMEELVTQIHRKAMTINALPLGGIRTRAHCADIARVADGDAKNGFIYIIIRLGQGRSDDVKRAIGDAIFKTLTDFTNSYVDAGNPLSLGLEIQEIEKDWTWKKNNIHQIIKDKNNG